jgi:aminoglycoside phosphotransferase (APT) family kinase protein
LLKLPNDTILCHGDLHPENYIVNDDYDIIDWSNGYYGHPASDIARTVLMFDSPEKFNNVPELFHEFVEPITRALKASF